MGASFSYEIEAFNTATASENRIHDDSMAKRFGFKGGLVPGVDVYAYMTRAGVLAFGERFLETGTMNCRFGQPVYDGETVSVSGELDDKGILTVTVTGRGQVLASGTASLAGDMVLPVRDQFETADLPAAEARPPADPTSLPVGIALGTLREQTSSREQEDYRASVRETHGIYADNGLVHPGYLLRRANNTLKDSVLLGPWIHVGSTAQHYAPLRIGEDLETRSRVDRLYDHKGHGFVELDVALFSGDRAVARISHTAIYEPRQVRQSA